MSSVAGIFKAHKEVQLMRCKLSKDSKPYLLLLFCPLLVSIPLSPMIWMIF
jgi:hypothetical protein